MKQLGLVLVLAFSSVALADITVYTDRPQSRFTNAEKLFTAKTGEKVVFVEAGYQDLLSRLEKEKSATPADLIITKDVVYLSELVNRNLLQPMKSSPSVLSVQPFMRDSKLNWVGLTFRARSIVYDPSRVDVKDVASYADLAENKFLGRLCLRSGKSAYNEALVATLIASYGESRTKAILTGWLENIGAPIYSDDLQVINAIANGVCDVGVVNHYYLAMSIAKNPNLPVKINFAEQNGRGVHTNGMGAGIVASSKKQTSAQAFVEILLTKEIQVEMSSAHMDYPVVVGVEPTSLIKDWGKFKMNSTPWNEVGNLAPKARALLAEVGYE